jgi:hypothetical protein
MTYRSCLGFKAKIYSFCALKCFFERERKATRISSPLNPFSNFLVLNLCPIYPRPRRSRLPTVIPTLLIRLPFRFLHKTMKGSVKRLLLLPGFCFPNLCPTQHALGLVVACAYSNFTSHSTYSPTLPYPPLPPLFLHKTVKESAKRILLNISSSSAWLLIF